MQKFRLSFLMISFSGVFLTLVKIILFPTPEKTKFNNFIFPEKVHLSQWQQVASNPLPQPNERNLGIVTQKYYRYQKNDLPIDIEMRYVSGGYISSLIKDKNLVSSSPTIRQRQEVGFYGIGIDNDKQRAYLNACINPYGKTTFTYKQFKQNQLSSSLNPMNILYWFLGEQQLIISHCIWTHLSVPLQNYPPEKAYQVLENAWFDWHQWWQYRVPRSPTKR